MVKREHLFRLKKLVNAGGEGINLAQNLLCAVALGEKLPPDFYQNRKVQQAFSGFRRYRFVRHVKGEYGGTYHITPKGENKLRNMLIEEIIIKNPKSWDGKWRLVIYDFPIRFKKAREAFRWKLKDLGFFQFQKSAWIYPYPCEDQILFIADFYRVQKHIEILEVDKILDDKKIKAHFSL